MSLRGDIDEVLFTTTAQSFFRFNARQTAK